MLESLSSLDDRLCEDVGPPNEAGFILGSRSDDEDKCSLGKDPDQIGCFETTAHKTDEASIAHVKICPIRLTHQIGVRDLGSPYCPVLDSGATE